PRDRLALLLDRQVDAAGRPLNDHLRDHVVEIAASPRGIPVSVAYLDTQEFMARARVVHNTIEIDPGAPTLTEVREMMDAVEAEIAADKDTAPETP
ncbi:MAG: hypothetical protein MJA32_01750, partial [Proteobacteria bacterium]|nr:hypothetical protein [Pseudomonadota bacterium]